MCFRKFFPGGVNDREMVDIIRVGALPRSPLKKSPIRPCTLSKNQKKINTNTGDGILRKRD